MSEKEKRKRKSERNVKKESEENVKEFEVQNREKDDSETKSEKFEAELDNK